MDSIKIGDYVSHVSIIALESISYQKIGNVVELVPKENSILFIAKCRNEHGEIYEYEYPVMAVVDASKLATINLNDQSN